MNVSVENSSPDLRQIIENLMLFFRYDIMPYIADGPGSNVNQFGTIDGETSRNHCEAVDLTDHWSNPESVLPFVIRANGSPAGFAIILRPPLLKRGLDFRMSDFFVLNRYRRQGVGQTAALALFDRFRGKWEVGALAKNESARLFWKSAVETHTRGNYKALTGMDHRGHVNWEPDDMDYFTFNNGASPES